MRNKFPNIGYTYMTLPNANLEEWCEKYDLEPFETVCVECGEKKVVNIPFVAKDRNVRGLVAPDCLCGSATFTYTDDELQKLDGLFEYMLTNKPKMEFEVIEGDKD